MLLRTHTLFWGSWATRPQSIRRAVVGVKCQSASLVDPRCGGIPSRLLPSRLPARVADVFDPEVGNTPKILLVIVNGLLPYHFLRVVFRASQLSDELLPVLEAAKVGHVSENVRVNILLRNDVRLQIGDYEKYANAIEIFGEQSQFFNRYTASRFTVGSTYRNRHTVTRQLILYVQFLLAVICRERYSCLPYPEFAYSKPSLVFT